MPFLPITSNTRVTKEPFTVGSSGKFRDTIWPRIPFFGLEDAIPGRGGGRKGQQLVPKDSLANIPFSPHKNMGKY
jgi:hypothetical protein